MRPRGGAWIWGCLSRPGRTAEPGPRPLRLSGGGGQLLCLCLLPVPPSIREDGRRANVSGLAGQSLTLECEANGFPAPEIVWLKDGQPVGVPRGGPPARGVWTGSCVCQAVAGDVTGVFSDAVVLRAGGD